MAVMQRRVHGRRPDQLRPIKITYNAFGYAPGSVLFELGNTKVLCSVSLQQGVPPFMKGKREGWLTAEYSLLPTSTNVRSQRENHMKRNDRAIEISRLIGRSLRAITNLAVLGERTIMVDCDVLQADGSTRTAAITGACLALQQAMIQWVAAGDIKESILREPIAAVSVGISEMGVLLDLDYQEDSSLDADYNVILTAAGTIIEIQGTAEKRALSWEQFEQMMVCARAGVAQMFDEIPKQANSKENIHSSRSSAAMFSLHSRLKSASE